MWPLIRSGKDCVEVKALDRQLRIGDIVVFRRSDGAYVVHRVYKLWKDGETQMVQTWGDNCQGPDAPVKIDGICGIVTKIYRGNKVISADDEQIKAACMTWQQMTAVRKAAIKSKRFVIKILGVRNNKGND